MIVVGRRGPSVARNIITLPIGACVTPEDAREVVEAMRALVG